MENATLSVARLRELFSYDPCTGIFTKKRQSSSSSAPKEPGTISNEGYRLIRIDYVQYKAHRLAWLYMTGEWPHGVIDHINQTRLDNRWENLRDVPRRVNNQNVSRARRDNTSGYRGVTEQKRGGVPSGRWIAQARAGGRPIYIGSYKTPEEASEAYEKFRRTAQKGYVPAAANQNAKASEEAA